MALFASLALAEDVVPIKNAGPFIPSPEAAVSAMLRYAHVGPDDFLIDLGSGDGRIVRTAAKLYGTRGLGIEIKEDLVRQANEQAKKEGIADRVKFVKQDLFKTDISQATVLTMYLLPDTVNMLRDKLATELRPGTRVVSHDYPLTGWKPDEVEQFDLPEKQAISGVQTTIVWLYIVPAKVEGEWTAKLPEMITRQPASLKLKQQFTRVSGTVVINGKEAALEDARLRGTQLLFRLEKHNGEFSGEVKGNAIEGMFDTGSRKIPWSASLGG
jgi:hypothetical protein